jgi:hypothetical protein
MNTDNVQLWKNQVSLVELRGDDTIKNHFKFKNLKQIHRVENLGQKHSWLVKCSHKYLILVREICNNVNYNPNKWEKYSETGHLHKRFLEYFENWRSGEILRKSYLDYLNMMNFLEYIVSKTMQIFTMNKV